MAFGQSIRLAKAFVEVGLDATEAQKGMRKFRNQFRSMRRVVAGTTAVIGTFGTAAAAAMLKAGAAAAAFEESISRFNIEFGKMAPQMRRFTEDLVNNLGQSRQQVTDMMSDFNAMMRKGGLQNSAAFAQSLSQRSIDIGSYYNREVIDVQRDIMSMLAGSSETMEKYSVNVKMAAVNQELLNNAIDPKKASEYQKNVARINILMRESAHTAGDAARTQGSLTNQWRAAQNMWSNTIAELGRDLLPALTQATKDFTAALKEMKPFLKDSVATMGKLMSDWMSTDREVMGGGDLAKIQREIARRETYGGFWSRVMAMNPNISGMDTGFGVMTSTKELKRRAGVLLAQREARNPANAPTEAAAAGTGGGQGLPGYGGGQTPYSMFEGAKGLGTIFGGRLGYLARANVRNATRTFAPMATDALRAGRRAMREQIKGMQAVRDEQKKRPISSHEIFTQTAFGGDFQRMQNLKFTKSTDPAARTATATESILKYIQENSVVFG